MIVVQEKERHIFYSSIQGVSGEICSTSVERSCVKFYRYNQSTYIDTTKVLISIRPKYLYRYNQSTYIDTTKVPISIQPKYLY
jgi:hypothetical protein